MCGSCPRRDACRWPGQFGRLNGKNLVIAPQQHLAVNAEFVGLIRRATGARRLLTLVDESDLLLAPARREVGPVDLERFATLVRAAAAVRPSAGAAVWAAAVGTFARARTADFQAPGWSFPPPARGWAEWVQWEGRARTGTVRLPGLRPRQFAGATRRPASDAGRGRRVLLTPSLEAVRRFRVHGGRLARYRLDPGHAGRPAGVAARGGARSEHPGTRWCCSGLGPRAPVLPEERPAGPPTSSAGWWPGTSPPAAGPSWSSAKVPADVPAGGAAARLGPELPGRRVVTGNWDAHDLHDPNTVAMITYGWSASTGSNTSRRPTA